MKTKFLFAALVLGLAVVACAPKAAETEEGVEVAKTAKDYIPSKAVVDSVSYLMGINFGSFIKGYDFGEDLNFAQIVKGMKDFIAAKGNMRDPEFGEQFKINPEKMNDLFNNYLENRHNYKLLVNKEAGEKFLAANEKKAGVRAVIGGQKPVADSAYKAAKDALNGWDPTGGAIYYFNPATATSKWIWSRPLITVIGKHRFCA